MDDWEKFNETSLLEKIFTATQICKMLLMHITHTRSDCKDL